jgi:predicted RND superfamily exporter protein
VPDIDVNTYIHDHMMTVGIVLAALAIGAWIVFKIIKKTIMLFLAVFLAIGAAGGAGAYMWWPN